jgi:poly(3-hydroxybutyrate) depolymerase
MMGRTAGTLLLALACLLGGRALAQAPDAAPVTGFEKLTIPLIAEGKPDKADSAVTGYLSRPPGAGPFPTVILLHGCDGLEWDRPKRAGWRLLAGYAERYRDHGYAALVLDSFQPRGVDNACGDPMTVSARRRAWDAYSAAAALVDQGIADRNRIVLQGESHGGWTTWWRSRATDGKPPSISPPASPSIPRARSSLASPPRCSS